MYSTVVDWCKVLEFARTKSNFEKGLKSQKIKMSGFNMITAKPEEAVVHPLVLLNCVDHYNRVAKNTSKRVVGVLLGRSVGGTVDITK